MIVERKTLLNNSYGQIDEIQHPIDMVEELAMLNSWDFNRITADKIIMNVEALWRNYILTLAISEKDKILKLVCSFEIKASKQSLNKIYETLNIINDRIWAGAFTYLPSENIIIYKYGLLLNQDYDLTDTQVDQMLSDALTNCECFYPSLQKVVWGGTSPSEAIGIAMMRTQGEA